jgi:cystathionine beta-lyase family protein involved in aluminum resistance
MALKDEITLEAIQRIAGYQTRPDFEVAEKTAEENFPE